MVESIKKYINKLKLHIRDLRGTKYKSHSKTFGGMNFPEIIGSGYNAYKSFAYACINARAENISKARFYLYEDLPGRNDKEITNHPFLDLLNKPNKRNQTFREIIFKIAVSLDLYGNAYLYVQRGTDSMPTGLYHLPSRNVRIKLNEDMTEIEGYIYTASGKQIKYSKRDIIHFLIPDPENNFSGRATIEGFNLTLEIDYLQNLYQRNFYRNDASPGMIIEVDREMMEAEFERFKEKFRALYEGAGNSGRTLFLDSGAKAKPFQAHPKDVEILNARVWIRDEIMSIFRVPKIILGVTTDVNRANAIQQIRTFNDNVIKPFAKLTIESKINVFLQENYPGEHLRLSMEYDFENDRELQLKAYELYMKYGIATREELREMEGL